MNGPEVHEMAKARASRNGRLQDALRKLTQSQLDWQQTQQQLQQQQQQWQQQHQQLLAALQQNLATLTQTQANFVAQMAAMKEESDRRFARIEAILLDHTRILQEHGRILAALPDAVREKIGFKGAGQQG